MALRLLFVCDNAESNTQRPRAPGASDDDDDDRSITLLAAAAEDGANNTATHNILLIIIVNAHKQWQPSNTINKQEKYF